MKYKCPKCGMIYDKPGNCDMDGAKLVMVEEKPKAEEKSEMKHENHDHHDHHKMMMDDFRRRFIVSAIVTVPVLILSPLIQQFLHFSLHLPFEKYILFALSSFIFFYGGLPFLKGIFEELRKKQPGMMTLIAIAISVAYFYSSAVVFGLRGKFFFW